MKRATLLSLLIYVLLIFGLATLDGDIIALVIPLVIYLICSVVYHPQALQIKAVRTLSDDHTAQGAPVTVKLSLTNEGPQIEELFVEDIVPRSLVITKGTPKMFTSLTRGETVEVEYTVSGKRGKFEFETVQLNASDHLDLIRRHAKIPVSTQFLVLPEMYKLGRVAIRPFRTRFYAGLNPSRQGGSGTDFFGVRMYQQGDPVRWINWKMSARHVQSLFTNEFESERIADVGMILDARKRSDVQTADDCLFNYAVRATASLAEVFLNDGNRVSLLIYGGTLQRTFPGYGKMQRERILCALARAQTGEHDIFKSLDYLPTQLFPAKSQLILISPLCSDDLPIFLRLRALGYHVLVISPDPVAFESAHMNADPDLGLATRIARIERKLLLHKLRRLGILVVDWQVNTPLAQTVLSSLSRLPHWLHTLETRV